MVEFLTTDDCNSAITRIVRGAHGFLWLISPYVQINDRLGELLERKNSEGGDIDMRLVYRKEDRRPFNRPIRDKDLKLLRSLGNLGVYRRENLHAKGYINEKEALVTSLNLYEYSQVSNDEWGILVSRQKDEVLYQGILTAANEIFDGSRTKLYFGRKNPPAIPPPPPPRHSRLSRDREGEPPNASPRFPDRRLHKRRRGNRIRNTQAVLRQLFQKLEQMEEPRIPRKSVPRLRM